jgi:hypothetical protein
MILHTRKEEDVPGCGNPVTSVRHLTAHSDGTCLGFMVLLWCPGCQMMHAPRFKCAEHGGPTEGPTWEGDPRSDPFTMSPSLLVHATSVSPTCHSFIKNGNWEFLGDCTHALAGKTVPLEPLPNWLVVD